jgi:hypothetical protein
MLKACRILQDGHMVMDKVLQLARKNKIKGLFACIHFKGAFDSVRHQAIWDTLEHLNCGPNLIAHLKTLYNGATSSVLNFGTKTTFFDLECSCRQGDPVAAYLFIIVIKILLNRIRRIVKGLNLGAGDLVVLAFADDLTIFVPNSEELAKAMCLIENFKAATGLQVNKEKSEILELGAKSTLIRVPVKLKVKITDMWFCLDKTSMSDTNWSAVQDRISVLLRSWRQRHITVMGRANIIKAQILPILSFIGTTIELPVSYEKAIVRDCFHFLWNAKTEKERRALCHKDFKDGGLAVPHFKSRLVAIKCRLIRRMKKHPGIFRHAFYKPHIN